MMNKLTYIISHYREYKFVILGDKSIEALEENYTPKKWLGRPVRIDLLKTNWIKKYSCLLICLLQINICGAQDKNFHTTIGLGIGPSVPIGKFKSKKFDDFNGGFSFNDYTGFKFILEQNIGKRIGISLNFYSMYYKFDISSFEKSLTLNNRGLTTDKGFKYEIQSSESEWKVNVENIGVYYYRNIGKKNNLLLRFIGSITFTEMYSPSFVIDIKDSSNNVVEVRTIQSAKTWREVFLFPPIDGFSIEINAQYFFTKHFAIKPSVYFVNSVGWFNGQEKALINLSKINYQAFNAMLGISYTFFYKKRDKQYTFINWEPLQGIPNASL